MKNETKLIIGYIAFWGSLVSTNFSFIWLIGVAFFGILSSIYMWKVLMEE